jgi:hypothetical protein
LKFSTLKFSAATGRAIGRGQSARASFASSLRRHYGVIAPCLHIRAGGKVETELSLRIAKALRRCALHEQVLSYQRFHALCEKGVPLVQRYAALETAAQSLADVRELDYGVLMALDSGLPGVEFFQRYLRHRHGEYVTLMGDPRYHRQTVVRKRALVAGERTRVYAHARQAEEERSRQLALA